MAFVGSLIRLGKRAWDVVKEVESVHGAVKDIGGLIPTAKPNDSPKVGITRSGANFRGAEPPAKRARVEKRNINHSSHNVTSKMEDHGDEVPIIPIPRRVAHSYADYTTIKLPIMEHFVMTTTTPDTSLITHAFRLNSVFDPFATSGTVHQPNGRDKFVAFGYKYYRVLEADVTIMWSNHSVSTAIADDVIVGYSLSDDTAVTYADYRAFVEAKHNSHRFLRSQATAWDGHQRETVLKYKYRPQEWDYHVQETGVEQRWTPIGENPANLHYIICHSGPALLTHSTRTQAYVNILYTVQFREIAPNLAIDSS